MGKINRNSKTKVRVSFDLFYMSIIKSNLSFHYQHISVYFMQYFTIIEAHFA